MSFRRILPLLVLAACAAQAQVAYPAKGQSASQQQRDQGECQAWAGSQAAMTPAPPPQQGAPVAGGALRGAARGAVVAEIADGDAGKGAAVGAVAGGVRGGAHRNQQAQQAQASAQQTHARAYAACMEGRGYTVK